MKLLTGIFLALAVALVPASLGAQAIGPRNLRVPAFSAIASTTLDAASTNFSINQTTRNAAWGLMLVYVTITDANDSVTDITMSCTASEDGNTTVYNIQSCEVSQGVCTSAPSSWKRNPSAVTSPKRWVWRVDIEGYEDLKCTFTDTGGNASDSIAVDVGFAVKGS